MLIGTETDRGKDTLVGRDSEQKFRSWELTVFGRAVFET